MSDLISRADVIEILATMQGLCRSKEALVHNSKIWSQVKDIPSAQRTGKWKTVYFPHESFGETPRAYYCSECNFIKTFQSNFCPYCGARMDEE